jgi:hypothetical protein
MFEGEAIGKLGMCKVATENTVAEINEWLAFDCDVQIPSTITSKSRFENAFVIDGTAIATS